MTTQHAPLTSARRVAVDPELLRRSAQQVGARVFFDRHGLSWQQVKVWAAGTGRWMPADLTTAINWLVVDAYAKAHDLEVTW